MFFYLFVLLLFSFSAITNSLRSVKFAEYGPNDVDPRLSFTFDFHVMCLRSESIEVPVRPWMHLDAHYVPITPGKFGVLQASVDRLFPPSATIYFLLNSNNHETRRPVHNDETLRIFFGHIHAGGERYEQSFCLPGCVNVSLDGALVIPFVARRILFVFPQRASAADAVGAQRTSPDKAPLQQEYLDSALSNSSKGSTRNAEARAI